MRVVCAGHVNWDVTIRVDDLPAPDSEARILSRRASGGGSAANVAVALVDLGIKETLVGSVGDDAHGRRIRQELVEHGVDIEGMITVADQQTAVKYLIVAPDGQVMVLGREGANEALAPADIDDGVVRGATHVHLTGQQPSTALVLAEAARSADIPVSVDPGRRLADRDYSAVLDRANVIFLNEREARDLEGNRAAEIIVKHGHRGAEVRTSDGVTTHEGFPVDAVDTAGAGDAFAAGYIATRIDGESIDRALAVGNACGALTARREGARSTLSRAAVEDFLGNDRP